MENDPWWQDFFDETYLQLWGGWLTQERTAAEVDHLWKLLELSPGMRVLDAPCGYGRIARGLAERGALVTGVDFSQVMIARAEAESGRGQGSVAESSLRYLRHDLRHGLEEGGFDVALNLFSSLGYGSEGDDLAVLTTLARSLRPGGRLLVETNHRDGFAVYLSRGGPPGLRLPDGTLILEQPRFDALAGRVETVWYYAGPQGAGSKHASIRMYSITELARLIEAAGMKVTALQSGCTSAPYSSVTGGRVGILAARE